MVKSTYAVGNWKMYKTAREATDYIQELLPLIAGCEANIFLAVPYTAIAPTAALAKSTPIAIGAQNMHDAREGAFTGEVASLMLKEAGASFVILGHSERRNAFGETNALIHNKVVRALQDDLIPILCIGETAAQRKEGKTAEILQEQLFSALADVPKEEAKKILVAYEPVWAIGSGEAASTEDVQKTTSVIRALLSECFGKRIGAKTPVLYGGSVTIKNISSLMEEGDINGVLVGGSSLDPATFASIAMQCTSKKTT